MYQLIIYINLKINIKNANEKEKLKKSVKYKKSCYYSVVEDGTLRFRGEGVSKALSH